MHGALRQPEEPTVVDAGESAALRRLEEERAAWAREKEILLEMLLQQQRVAQAGLVTAGLAHDIRNQLQIMMGSAEVALVCDDVDGFKEALAAVVAQCRDVAETTDAFLAFTRRQTASDARTFSLSHVLEHCRRLLGPLAKDRGIPLRCEAAGEGYVRGSHRIATQALVNLTANAVKACGEHGGGEVTVTVSRPRGDVCRLTVADTGPGVPEQVRARLFRPFTTTGERTGGSGLGLFIVRQAVLDLGGRIQMKTSPAGTTVRIDLPAAQDVSGEARSAG